MKQELSPDWTPTIPPAGQVERFDQGERWTHWTTAFFMGVCMFTAAALYFPSLAIFIGRRATVREFHVVAGLMLPVPTIIAVARRKFGDAFRRDVRRLNRWFDDDRRWLRSFGRDPFVTSGKFNAGQKLNAAFIAGSIILMVTTGSVMKWFGPFPLTWRTGATFVHDWTAAALLVVLIGHIAFGLSDPDAFRAMRRGPISRKWASRHAPRWLTELDEPDESSVAEREPLHIGE